MSRRQIAERLSEFRGEMRELRDLPNVLRYQVGENISDLGSEATSFVLMAYVYLDTGSLTQFGLLFALDNLPDVALSPFVGELTDRINRRLLVLIADFGLALVTVAAMILALTGGLSVTAVYVLVGIGACFDVLVDSASDALYQEIVPDGKLVQTGAVMGTAGELVDVLGPAVGISLLALFGLEAVFVFDLLTFGIGLFALATLKLGWSRPGAEDDDGDDEGRLFVEGVRYLGREQTARRVVGYSTVDTFLSSAVALMIAVVALESGGEQYLALVQGAAGIGSTLGLVAIAVFGIRTKRVFQDNVALPGLLTGLVILVIALEPTIVTLVLGGFVVLVLAAPLDATLDALSLSLIPHRLKGRVSAVEDIVDGSLNLILLLVLVPIIDRFAESQSDRIGVYTAVLVIAGIVYVGLNLAALRWRSDPALAAVGARISGGPDHRIEGTDE